MRLNLNPKVRDIMTANPIFSLPDASVESVACLMADSSCGEIPICKDGRVVGIVTDRDVTCRVVAAGRSAADTKVREIMTLLPVTIFADEPLHVAIDVMEKESVRRLPVVDANGGLVGIVSQVDIAQRASERKAGRLLAIPRPQSLSNL